MVLDHRKKHGFWFKPTMGLEGVKNTMGFWTVGGCIFWGEALVWGIMLRFFSKAKVEAKPGEGQKKT